MSLQQMIPLLRGQIELQRVGGERQRLRGDVFEIGVAAGRRPQPCVFELAGSPCLDELTASSREEGLATRRDGARVEDRERIERDGAELRGAAGRG